VDKVLAEVNPEAMLVLGDTNSCMAVLSAKRRKIPTFHMEAGNRCFDQRVPEEINRRLVDHMADINLTYSSIARDYLLREGLPADMIIKIGSPMFEVLNTYRDGIDSSDVLVRLGLQKYKFFVVSAHREENVDSNKNFSNLVESLNTIAKTYQMPVIVSTHPRTQKRVDAMGVEFNPLVQFLKPLGFKDYNKLQVSSKATLSDSGTINEESSILNFPALNLREAHERPEGMEETAVIMAGLGVQRIMQGLAILESQPRDEERLIRQVYDYSMPNVSDKIVRIIHSYTDYVNRVVWKKY
jgi:UDP-N-acetylglucosamine 2-epimerase